MENLNFEYEDLGPIWHLCTPGEFVGVIFKDRDDYVFGMNLVALCAANFTPQLKILTFQIMSNHLHFVIECEEPAIGEFFTFLKKRLQRYLANSGYLGSLSGFVPNYFRINESRYLQNVIVYVNRNGYLVDKQSTPLTYEWGANRFFFNKFTHNELVVNVGQLSLEKRRAMFKSRNFEIPADYIVTQGYISPLSYCHITLAESFFKDANHYFHLSSRQIESYSSIAKELGDKVTYTDYEIYSAIMSLCIRRYEVKNPSLLDKDAKIEVAKIMHFDYNASNKQIKRVLRLDENVIESLFPR
jgi:REP element-mobilizing transposase RayT